MEYLKSLIEALIFIADEPLTLSQINALLTSEEGQSLWSQDMEEPHPSNKEVKQAIESLKEDYENHSRGLILSEVAGGYQFRTQKQFSSWIQAYHKPNPTRLSTAALEALSIIVYRQPITRPEIEDIRGVDSGGVLRSLLERRLIRIIGKKEEPGNPLIYGSSSEFLEVFGLKNLSDLPPLKEFENLVKKEGEEAASEASNQVNIKDLITSEETLVAIEEQEQKSIEGLEGQMKELRNVGKHVASAIMEPKKEEEGGEVGETSAEPPQGETSA